MGDKRKLQSEIDRTLKKIDEGLDVYDRISAMFAEMGGEGRSV